MRRLASIVIAAALAIGVPAAVAAAGPASHHGHKLKGKNVHQLKGKNVHPLKGKGAKVTNATFGASTASASKATHGKILPDGRPYFTINTTPGGSAVDHIAVTNYAYKPLTVQIYTVDAVPAQNGTISFPLQSAKRTGAGAWLAVGTPDASGKLRLAPRTIDVLPVHIRVPANAPPGDNVGAVVVSLSGRVQGKFGSGSGTNAKFAQRIAVRAVFRVTGPVHPKVDIENLKASYGGPLNPFAKGHATVSYDVHNGGNVVFGGPQTVEISGLFGEHKTDSTIADLPPLLPGATYPVKVTVPGIYPELLMKAKVTVHPVGLQGAVDTGLVSTSSSVHFLAIPWILLIVLLLFLLGLAVLYRRRRRRAKGLSEPGAVV